MKEEEEARLPEGHERTTRDSAPAAAEPAQYGPAKGSSLSQRRVWLIFALLVLVAGVAIIRLAKGGKKAEADEAGSIVVSVRVAKAERGAISSDVSAVGTIVPRQIAVVSSKLNAQIKQMALVRNKEVAAGDVVATLDVRDIQAQRAEAAAALEEADAASRLLTSGTIPETASQDERALRDARANVANARATYDRRRTLYEQGGISKKEIEASQLALTTAENDLHASETAARLHQTATSPNSRALAAARIQQAQQRLAALDTQLSYATIRAPFSGIITEQFQYQGEYAAAGAKLFTVADVSEVIIKAPFADNVAGQLKVGDAAAVLPQGRPGETLTGRISLVSRSSDSQSRAVEVWVTLKNEGGRLRADGAAKITASAKTETNALIVPVSAVSLDATNSDKGKVMLVDEQSVAREKEVTVGIRSADHVQIISGLEEGATVVIEGNYALPDGTKVQVNEGEAEEESEDKKKPRAEANQRKAGHDKGDGKGAGNEEDK